MSNGACYTEEERQLLDRRLEDVDRVMLYFMAELYLHPMKQRVAAKDILERRKERLESAPDN